MSAIGPAEYLAHCMERLRLVASDAGRKIRGHSLLVPEEAVALLAELERLQRLATPDPAALEAVYQVVETLLDVANLAVITPQDEIHVGPVIYAASGAQVKALRDAAAMLRAALSAMEEPTEAMLAAVEFGDAEGT